MGQRLVIDIKRNGIIIGNCYYHWSGYTRCALEVAYDIIKNYNSRLVNSSLESDLFAVRMFQLSDEDGEDPKSMAGLCDNSLAVISDKYSYLCKDRIPDANDRNDGLIGITKNDIDNNTFNEETSIVIDLDNKRIAFNVMSYYGGTDDWKEEMKECGYEEEELDASKLLVAPYDVNDFGFLEIEEMIEFFDKVFENGFWFFNTDGDSVYGLIE